MADTRLPPPQINVFRKFVIDELLRRKYVTSPVPITAPMMRMTSCLESQTTSPSYKYFTLGLHGAASSENLFDLTYGSGREFVGYAYVDRGGTSKSKEFIDVTQISQQQYVESVNGVKIPFEQGQLDTINRTGQLQKDLLDRKFLPAKGAHPMPGIVNVAIDRYAQAAGMRATVSWTCYNRQQLEFLRHHFMTVGTNVVIEWGNNFSNRYAEQLNYKLLDFSDPSIDQILAESFVRGRHYIISNYVEPSQGNYDYIVGTVGNFNITFEPTTNVYQCSTVVHSSGEFLWGINVSRTFVDLSSTAQKTQTFFDFFRPGGGFDKLLESNTNLAEVTTPQTKHDEATLQSTEEFKNWRSSSRDFQFVSWHYFADTIIKTLLSTISTNSNARKDLLGFISFVEDATAPNTPDSQKLWVGDNEELRSVEPETLLLIKSPPKMSAPEHFIGNGFFDRSGASPDRGLLNQGVWLNAGAIRECFIQAVTFEEALRSLLIRMNNAVANYWQLQLYWDEDSAQYKIIDGKFSQLRPEDITDANPLYRFNTTSIGECVGLNLDSAFPPEVVTHLAIVARLKSDPNLLAESLEKYPLIGTTSHFAFALNWTDLKDTLVDKIKAIRETQRTSVATPVDSSAPQQVNDTSVLRNTVRIQGDMTTVAPSTMASPTSPPPGNAVQSNVITTQPLSFDDVIPATRNSVTPTISPEIRVLNERLAPYENIIQSEGRRISTRFPTVDGAAMIKAIIATESSGVESATVYQSSSPGAPRKVAVGLMQVMNTSVSPQLTVDTAVVELRKPDRNIREGVNIFLGMARTNSIEDTLSAYNGGHRPHLGLGSRKTGEPTVIQVCLFRNPDGSCRDSVPVRNGQYANQSYITKILRLYNEFKLASAISQSAPTAPPIISNPPPVLGEIGAPLPPQPAQTIPTPPQESTTDAAKIRSDDIRFKFGDTIISMVDPNLTDMVIRITKSGLRNHQTLANSFVAPFPTTAKVEITIPGIAGISIFDGFAVDKLPFIYERYGIWHITQMSEVISAQGWFTKIVGYFRFLYFGGDTMTKLKIVPSISTTGQ